MSTASTSEVFDFLEKHTNLVIEKHIIASSDFSLLRSSIRRIIFMLRDSDDESAILATLQLRRLLSEWLTVPVPFDDSMQIALEECLGTRCGIKKRWGRDLFEYYDKAWNSAQSLSEKENPLRIAVLKQIRNLRTNHNQFRVFCHRLARKHFERIVNLDDEPPLLPSDFLHSLREYEAMFPADALIKVGPLRATGWGRVPDAIVNAPRFTTIHQFVWPGCGDDEDFGFDAASSETPSMVSENEQTTDPGNKRSGFVWRINLIEDSNTKPNGLKQTPEKEDEDDLQLFRKIPGRSGKRKAILVKLKNEYSVLYPRLAHALSFDPDTDETDSIGSRLVCEDLREDMFVIFPDIHDVDLGELQAEHGGFSQIWRERLELEWQKNPETLIQRLQTNGLNLLHLRSSIERWLKSPDTVIHAPQSTEHFHVLMKVLNCNDEYKTEKSNHVSRSFEEKAWLEVRRSRGEAIQTGFQEQVIVEEEITGILKSMLPEIKNLACINEKFILKIPEERGLQGLLQFHKVTAIEEGYLAPDSELKVIQELTRSEIWRE